MSVKHGPSEQEIKKRKELDNTATLLRETKEKMLAVEREIRSLGQNLLEHYQREETVARAEIERGGGSFVNLDKIIESVADAVTVNNERDLNYKKWNQLRLRVTALDAQLLRLRLEYDRIMKADYATQPGK